MRRIIVTVKFILSFALSLILFLGGVTLILAHIPVWSIVLGVPATLIGISLIILTFDKLNQRTLETEEF